MKDSWPAFGSGEPSGDELAEGADEFEKREDGRWSSPSTGDPRLLYENWASEYIMLAS